MLKKKIVLYVKVNSNYLKLSKDKFLIAKLNKQKNVIIPNEKTKILVGIKIYTYDIPNSLKK
jgi:hypothetical protein